MNNKELYEKYPELKNINEIDKTSTNNTTLPYCFKFYYTDGTTEYVGGKGISPTSLYNDFDGLMDWTEFYKLQEQNMTTTKILEMAMELYKDYLKKEYYRIDIVNQETNEIIDSIEKRNR